MENRYRVPFWVFFSIVLCGIWLIASTTTFDILSTPIILSNLISGFLLIILGLLARRNMQILWVIALIGIWLQIAPLIFWAQTNGAYINNTLIGILIIALSILFFQKEDEEPSIPPGWSYNPSSWAQRLPIAFFAFICWMISHYLASYQLGYIHTVWDPFFPHGTEKVLASSVSKLFPVPDAGLGALAYTLEFLSTCFGGKARWRTSPWGVILFGLLVVPVGIVSVILIIAQPLIVGTWCTLCLVTAFCMLIPIPLAIDEVVAAIRYLRHKKIKGAKVDKKTPSADAPLYQILKASLWGVSFPWNLLVTLFIGIYLMTQKQLDPMLGALTIVISVISFSEYMRYARYFNIFIALLIVFFAWTIEGAMITHGLIALAILILSLRKGRYAHRSV
ncbi:MAG TPA: vitamin K epoxide reductase family protein [Chlamydiales bacterium]|nr:vitamin K epoxide reductase family protein [Chlamydiales bacterium]